MTLQGALALELRRDDDGFEMSVVVGADAHLRAGQPGLDQRLNFGGIHRCRRDIELQSAHGVDCVSDAARYDSAACSRHSRPAALDPDAAARARPTRRCEIEARAVQALQARLDDGVRRGLPAAARLHRPRGRDRHGQVRSHRQQDRRHARQHRHAGVFPASRRGQPRRHRHDHARRRGASRSPTPARPPS